MQAFVVNECPSVRILYGSSVQNVNFWYKKRSEVEIKRGDGASHSIQATLVLACDGTNSALVNTICNDPSGMVTSSKLVQDKVLYLIEAGLAV